MITIKSPLQYLNQADVLQNAGEYIKLYGHRALVIGSRMSFYAAEEKLFSSFKKNNIEYSKALFEGFPNEKLFTQLTALAQEFHADVIIGLGGGRVLDTAKVVGNQYGAFVVAIPTIAATCAGWAASSIIYDEEGAFTGGAFNKNSPQLIIADTRIIASAPSRYIKAGIIDTLAKFYETEPHLVYANQDLTLRHAADTARLAYDQLTGDLDKVLKDLDEGYVSVEVSNTIDSVLYLAGLVGSLAYKLYVGFAHSFYNTVTKLPGTRNRLHGEKIAFGLLVQFVLQKKTPEEIRKELKIFKKLDQPLTLGEIGIDRNDGQSLKLVSQDLVPSFSYISFLSEKTTAEEIRSAILEADEIGKQFALK